jgi:hypothetical protein
MVILTDENPAIEGAIRHFNVESLKRRVVGLIIQEIRGCPTNLNKAPQARHSLALTVSRMRSRCANHGSI